MAIERIIGIDFGTSTSVIRVKRYNGSQPVDNRLRTDKVVFDSRTTVPTLIRQSSKGRYCGYEAEKLSRGDKQFKGFKVDLESEIPQLREQARELTKEFFCYLYKIYSSQSEGGHLGEPGDIERTIVSYPVKWSDETREFMLQAARDAKFKNVEGMDEAQAAIHAVTVQNENQLKEKGYLVTGRASNILLIDMGAGTTDLVLCKYTPGSTTEIICTWPVGGEVLFGGQEMEKILRSYIGCYLDKDNPMSERLLNNLGELTFKSWKENTVSKSLLHSETVKEFSELENLASMAGIEVRPFKIDRTELEVIAKSYLSQFAQLVNGCLNEASKKGVRREDIDLVVLTGGHSQWYFVKEMLLDKSLINLPKIREDSSRILDTALPQETVALGMVFKPLSVNIKEKRADAPITQNSTSGKIPYRMYIEEVFTITNRGYAVCGRGEGGVLKLGDCIDILDGSTPVANADVAGIETHKKTLTEAHDNQAVGIYVKSYSGISPDQWKGMNLVSAGTQAPDGTYSHVNKNANKSAEKNKSDQPAVKKKSGIDYDYYSKNFYKMVVWYNHNDYVYFKYLHPAGYLLNESGNISAKDIACVSNSVAVRKDGTVDMKVSEELTEKMYLSTMASMKNLQYASADNYNAIALYKDGSVWASMHDISKWNDIISVFTWDKDVLGLRRNGRVVHSEWNEYLKTFVTSLRNIVMISVQINNVVALREDGTVSALNRNHCVSNWKNIVCVSGVRGCILGVTRDGKVLCTDNEYGLDFSDWNHIIAVAADQILLKKGYLHICIAGLNDQGKILLKEYRLKVSFLGNVKSAELYSNKVLEYGIFDDATNADPDDDPDIPDAFKRPDAWIWD